MYEKNDTDNQLSELTKEQRKKLASTISERFRTATADIQDKVNASKEAWSYYIQNTPDKAKFDPQVALRDTQNVTEDNQRGLRMGVIHKVAISVMAYMANIIFPQDERFFRATPRNGISQEWQEAYEQDLSERWAESNLVEEVKKYILSGILDPTACAAVTWHQKKGKKVKYVPKYAISLGGVELPIPIMGGMKKVVEEDAVKWEGTCFKTLDFNDWRIDPCARDLDETWFIRRWYQPTWEVKQEYGLTENVQSYKAEWDNLGELDKLLLNNIDCPIKHEEESDGKKQALLMCCYDDFVIEGKVYENYMALCLNGTDIIWFGPNKNNHGKKPFVLYSFNPIPNQLYGVSLVHHALPSASVVDKCASDLLHIGTWAAKPVFEADMQEPVFKKSRAIRPGMTFPVRRVGAAIRQVPINVTNLTILQSLMEQAEVNIKEVTGTSQMMLGEGFDQPANITAFQVDQTLQGTGSLFQSFIRNLCNTVIEPFLEMAYENDKQYRTQDVFITEDTILTPDILKQTEYKWVTTSNQAVQSRAKRLANLQMLLTQLIPTMVQNGLAQLTPNQLVFDVPEITKEMVILGGETASDKYMQIVQGVPNGPAGLPPNVGPGAGLPPEAAQGPPVV